MRMTYIRNKNSGREVKIPVAVYIIDPHILCMVPDQGDLIRHAGGFMQVGPVQEFLRFRTRHLMLDEVHWGGRRSYFTMWNNRSQQDNPAIVSCQVDA